MLQNLESASCPITIRYAKDNSGNVFASRANISVEIISNGYNLVKGS